MALLFEIEAGGLVITIGTHGRHKQPFRVVGRYQLRTPVREVALRRGYKPRCGLSDDIVGTIQLVPNSLRIEIMKF